MLVRYDHVQRPRPSATGPDKDGEPGRVDERAFAEVHDDLGGSERERVVDASAELLAVAMSMSPSTVTTALSSPTRWTKHLNSFTRGFSALCAPVMSPVAWHTTQLTHGKALL